MTIYMTNRTKGIIALFLLSVIWASFGLPIRYLSNHFALIQQIYLRILPAAVFGTIIFYKDLNIKKFFTMPKKQWLVLIFRCVVLYGFAVIPYTMAYTLTTYSDVSFLGSIPTTAVLGFILLRERITKQKLLWVLVSVAGILLITIKNYHQLFSWSRGDELALFADLFFSLSYIGRKWQSSYLNNKEISVFMLYFGTVFLFLVSLTLKEGIPSVNSFNIITSLVILGAGILNVGSLFFVNYGFEYVEAALASNIVSLESFFAVIYGFVLFKEIPTFQSLIGGLLIIGSVVFLNKEEEKK